MAEMASEETSFLAVCAPVAKAHGIAAQDLARAVRAQAGELWRGFEAHPFCRRIGFASWEGLWSTFAGSAPELETLRNWAATYHHEAWARGLADVGIDDSALADELSAKYQRERQQHHVVFAQSAPALEELQPDYRLGLLTNGAEDVQSRKTRARFRLSSTSSTPLPTRP